MGNRNSGRKPKPTALKILQGNPGQRRLNMLEPKTPEGEPTKPEGLSAKGSQVWDQIAPGLLYMGTLTAVDAEPFARMCELTVTAREASLQKDAPGFGMFTISQDYNGADKVGVHAAIRVERETATALRPYYEYFGMTPSARARIQVAPKAEAPASKWAGVMK